MSQWRVPLADLVLAVVLAAAGVAIARLIDPHLRPGTPLDVWGVVLIVAAALALAVRRRWPMVAVAGCAGATTLYLLLGHSYGPIFVNCSSLCTPWRGTARPGGRRSPPPSCLRRCSLT